MPSITEMVIAWDITKRELEAWNRSPSDYFRPDRTKEAEEYVRERKEAIEFWGDVYRALHRQLRDALREVSGENTDYVNKYDEDEGYSA